MKRGVVVLVAVLAMGYAIYGGLFLAAGVIQSSLAEDSGAPTEIETSAPVERGQSGPFDFAPVTVGIDYSADSRETGFMEIVSRSGVYSSDYNGDGWTDVLAVGGDGPVLFENTGGEFEVSGALPEIRGQVRGATFLDYNVDGRPDLVLLADGRAPLLLENVGGTYEKRGTFGPELTIPSGATVADYNRDGCPDLFVYQYANWTERLPIGYRNYSASLNDDNGNPDQLYRGTCSGFEPVDDAGSRGSRWTLASSFVDLNGDGYPDIHQANDINHDVVYVNQRDGTFKQVQLADRTNRNGMSSEIFDVDVDGRIDVFVTNIHYPEWAAEEINSGLVLKAAGNNLISNHGNATFVERADQYGVQTGGWGWAAVAADFDNDGDEDLFHTTRDVDFERRDVLFTDEEIATLNAMEFYSYPAVWARAKATSFEQLSARKSGFEDANGRGVTRLDYDRDGDVDLVTATTGEYQVYENRQTGGNALQVRVLGREGSQTAAYGATVYVEGPNRTQQRRVHGRSDFYSQDSRVVHVGLGNATAANVRVVWPDGTQRRIENVTVGQRLVATPSGVERIVQFEESAS